MGLTAFAIVERRQSSPMVDFSFFRSRTFLGANIVASIVSFAMLALPQASSTVRAHLAAGLGSGEVPHGVPVQIVDAGQRAFVYALQYGLRLGSAVALLGALLAWTLVRARTGAAQELKVSDPRPIENHVAQGAVAPVETIHV